MSAFAPLLGDKRTSNAPRRASFGRARSRASGMRRIGLFLSTLPADDPRGQARITAFVQWLQELGRTDGRNMRIAHRWLGRRILVL